LQSYFSLDFDPFYPHKEAKSYKTKFTIFFDENAPKEIPNIEIESPTDESDLDREIKEHLAQQAPANIVEDEDIWDR
jgi:hypothetical protein